MSLNQLDRTQEEILIVDDNSEDLNLLSDTLAKAGYKIFNATNGSFAIKVARKQIPDLILLDVILGDMDGFEVCRLLKKDSETANIPVIFVTGSVVVESVIKGFEAGGVDYVTKPYSVEEVIVRVRNHLKIQQLTKELSQKNYILQQEIEKREKADKERDIAIDAKRRVDEQLSIISNEEAKRWGIDAFIGKSPSFTKILDKINRLQGIRKINILITGETGTGKEMVARFIHYGGLRGKGPFIPVNCANISKDLAESEFFGHVKGAFTGANENRKGKFELADGGTLFLDEIEELPPDIQTKFLRVLEDGYIEPIGGIRGKYVDVRVFAATNINLEDKIKQGSFRSDIYQRLNQYPVFVEPLCDRREDIPLLSMHFLDRYALEIRGKKLTLTPEALAVLESYSFEQGNIRELKNIIMRAIIECDGTEILPKHLSIQSEQANVASPTLKYSKIVDEHRCFLIKQALDKFNGNRSKAADFLGMDRSNLVNLMKRLKIIYPHNDNQS